MTRYSPRFTSAGEAPKTAPANALATTAPHTIATDPRVIGSSRKLRRANFTTSAHHGERGKCVSGWGESLAQRSDQRSELGRVRFEVHSHAEIAQGRAADRPDRGDPRALQALAQRIDPSGILRDAKQVRRLHAAR